MLYICEETLFRLIVFVAIHSSTCIQSKWPEYKQKYAIKSLFHIHIYMIIARLHSLQYIYILNNTCHLWLRYVFTVATGGKWYVW